MAISLHYKKDESVAIILQSKLYQIQRRKQAEGYKFPEKTDTVKTVQK
jgi:hypothetical protein